MFRLTFIVRRPLHMWSMFSMGGFVRKRSLMKALPAFHFHRSGPQSLDHQSTAQLNSYANDSGPDTKRWENSNLVCKNAHFSLLYLFEAPSIEANNPLWVHPQLKQGQVGRVQFQVCTLYPQDQPHGRGISQLASISSRQSPLKIKKHLTMVALLE
jgi:hypothetical protein